MTNEIAAPCCGSCKLWDDNRQFCKEHNEYAQGSHLSCEGEDYSPRHPVPITDLSGIKELIKTAFRAVVINRLDWPFDNTDDLVSEYMATLGDKS